MSIEVKETVRELVMKKANEGPTLDYKVQEYDIKNKKSEVLKDTIAMLNSIDSLDKDKFIILGISDKKYLVGLETEMNDDNEYQHIFNKINPRPFIDTGVAEVKGKTIGYIHIKKENNKWPYEIGKDTEKYTCGTSFVRIGSTTERMDRENRIKLTLIEYETNGNKHPSFLEIEKENSIKNSLIYTDKNLEGSNQLNPSLNNGKFTIGKDLNEFILKFQVPTNDKARIYNDHGIKVSRLKGDAKFWNELEKIDTSKLDFSNRIAECTYDDLVYIVNEMGGKMILKINKADSESHGKEEDYISFEWKILT